jgi:threonine/homoserine/homoserine lactone efflux protein
LSTSQSIFTLLKWAGVLYLAYLGIRLIISTRADLLSSKARSLPSLYWQGFITSAANPKAVIFFAALLPQLLSTERALFPQFLILSATYLTIDAAFLCLYGKFAEVFRQRVLENYGRLLNSLAGGIFITAAILLGLKDFERR